MRSEKRIDSLMVLYDFNAFHFFFFSTFLDSSITFFNFLLLKNLIDSYLIFERFKTKLTLSIENCITNYIYS